MCELCVSYEVHEQIHTETRQDFVSFSSGLTSTVQNKTFGFIVAFCRISFIYILQYHFVI